MRARIKVQPDSATPGKRNLLAMGIFDRVTKKAPCTLSVPMERATGVFEWYDLGEWTDEGHEYILYMDPRGSTFSFDCVEVSVAPGRK